MTDTIATPRIDIQTNLSADENTGANVDTTTNLGTEVEAVTDTDAESNSAPVYRILDLQESERPRERLIALGAQALTNAELIAILLHVGVPGENAVQVGQRLLNRFSGLRGLHRAPFSDLIEEHGLKKAKAAQIKAAIELGRRLTLESPEERASINSPADAASLVQYEMSALEQEHLRVILLDRRNRVVETVEVYKGSVNSSQVRVGEIFKEAVRKNSSALIVIHNHPSGDPTPSPDDVAVTRAIVQAGKLLDIEVLDHLVIGAGRWISLKERGLGFA
jgi:DNA repair protein RadC